MIVGFNHNILYRGVGFHVQTEDGGLKSPSLVTLLYHGGIIVTSQKTSYADILGVDNLNQVVEDLAKEQHKGMLRRLTKGEFDERILALDIPIEGLVPVAPVPSAVAESPAKKPAGEPLASADRPETAVAAEGSLGEAALEPALIDSPAAVAEKASVETEAGADPQAVAGMAGGESPRAIEPAFEPPAAEDRPGQLDLSTALDDLIFSYLTGGNEKS